MSLDAPGLLKKHRASGVLVDANLLVLYIVGLVNRKRIATFKRTQSFTVEDFDFLVRILKHLGPRIVSTPHVLSQVSDLTDLSGPELHRSRILLRMLVERMEEHYDSSKELVTHPLFSRLGLGDAGIATVCAREILVLTSDLDLWMGLEDLGADAINFNHFRLQAWR